MNRLRPGKAEFATRALLPAAARRNSTTGPTIVRIPEATVKTRMFYARKQIRLGESWPNGCGDRSGNL
jgi:hypothetical protein